MKKSMIEILLVEKVPFAVGVGDLFGMMDWFFMIHENDYEYLQDKELLKQAWSETTYYYDVYTRGMSKQEVKEFREKYMRLFYCSQRRMEGAVYELKNQPTFKETYKKNKKINPAKEKIKEERLARKYIKKSR